MEKKPIPFVRKLCAHLSEEEILAAEERLRDYIRLAMEIHAEAETEGKEDVDVSPMRPVKLHKGTKRIEIKFIKDGNQSPKLIL